MVHDAVELCCNALGAAPGTETFLHVYHFILHNGLFCCPNSTQKFLHREYLLDKRLALEQLVT